MNTFQNLDNEKIEKESIKRLNAIKLKEELYIVPEYVVKSTQLDREDLCINKDVVEKIVGLKINNGDAIVTLLKEKIDQASIIQMINLNTGEAEEFSYEKELTEEAREEIINSIAYKHKDKEVIVSFYLSYNLEGLKKVLENIQEK